mgnify:CR=1 FL=1
MITSVPKHLLVTFAGEDLSYLERLFQMTQDELRAETESQIWLRVAYGYTDVGEESDYKVKACFEACKKFSPTMYEKAIWKVHFGEDDDTTLSRVTTPYNVPNG